MENTIYSKQSRDLNLMDTINIGLVIILSLKNILIFVVIFFILIGFYNTSKIKPEYLSTSRLLIELKNNNLKDEQNIDFTSLNIQAIQTEIEKIYSNTMIHNIIRGKNIDIPEFQITRENSSIITIFSDSIIRYSGLKFIFNLFNDASNAVTQKAIETTLDITLDTVVNSVDDQKVSDIGNKIRNEFQLNERQNKKLNELQEKFKKDKPDSEEVMTFAYDILSSNEYTDQDIINLARNYLPDSIQMSDEILQGLIDNYKQEFLFNDNEIYGAAEIPDDLDKNKTIVEKDILVEKDLLSSHDKSENISSPEIQINKNSEVVDYFDRANNKDFNLKLIEWLRSNLSVRKERNASVINISFVSSDPNLSILISNAVAEEYLNYQIITKKSAGLYSTEYYQERIDELRIKQDELSDNILSYESENDIYDSKIDNLEIDLKKHEDELRDLNNEKDELLKIYTIKHPEVIKVNSKVNLTNKEKNELIKQISIARSDNSKLYKLESEFQVNETLLTTYLNKLLTVSSYNQSDARVLERSDKSILLNANDAIKKLLIFTLYGLLLCFVIIIFVVFLDFYSLFNRFHIQSQIKEKTGIDPLGTIPHIKDIDSNKILSFDLEKNKALTDSLKKTIIKITGCNLYNNNTYVITSAISSDGKTLNTILFGLVARNMGKRVLLIDMDEEKKTLSKVFLGKDSTHKGFTNYRERFFEINMSEEYILRNEETQIDILPSGNYKDGKNSNLDEFAILLRELSKKYDLIICDTMPITYHPDSIMISKFATSILTIRYNSTPIAIISHILDEFKRFEFEKPQIIFNDIDFSSKRVFRLMNFTHSGEYSYGYGYGYNYRYGYDYGYGYGYGYGVGISKKKTLGKKIFKLLFNK